MAQVSPRAQRASPPTILYLRGRAGGQHLPALGIRRRPAFRVGSSWRLLRAVLTEPHAQWHVSVGWRVTAVGIDPITEQLPANRIAAPPQTLHRHVILGANPAVAVAVKEHFARHPRPVGAGRVPQAPVEEDGR